MINDSINHRLRLRSIRQSNVQSVLDFEKKNEDSYGIR